MPGIVDQAPFSHGALLVLLVQERQLRTYERKQIAKDLTEWWKVLDCARLKRLFGSFN
jgi:hypothetical protein